MKLLLKAALFCTLAFTTFNFVNGQTTKKDKHAAKLASIKNMIDSVRYVFTADYAYPLRGPQKNLTSDYDLRVSKDTVTAYLPYYGRAYLAPYNPTDGGIKFTTTKFDYSTVQKKNGSWQITIKPRDHDISDWKDVQLLTLEISPEGYTSLQVLSSNRDAISFNGTVERK